MAHRGAADCRIYEADGHCVAGSARGAQALPDLDQRRITAVRKLAVEAADNGLLTPELASGIARIKGVRSHGIRVGNWQSLRQAQALLNAPDVRTKKGLRDRAMFACELLRRRHVTIGLIKYIGKESNAIEDLDSGLIHATDEVYTEYVDRRRDEWQTVILPALRKWPLADLVTETGMSRRAIIDLRAGRSRPHSRNCEMLAGLVRVR